MLKRVALMESISSNLHGFLQKIGNNLSVPDKKFLRDSLIYLIRCGKPMIHITQIGSTMVRLPGRAEDLTLVVSRLAGNDTPMILPISLNGSLISD